MERYVIKIETTDKDGVKDIGFLTKNGKTVLLSSLSDTIDARDSAQKWVKGEYMICVLQELPNV
jgi:hypothetical protein